MSLNKIVKDLKINSIFTKTPKKQKLFNHVKDGIVPVAGYNYNADLLYLPKTDNGNKYLLVCVDLADNSFDIQELKNRDAKSVLEGLQKMFKRGFLKKPEISIRTDSGSEFQKEFNKYLKDNKIIHSQTLPDRHKQNSNVENLNKQLGNVFIHYMNSKEIEEGEQYDNWDDITDTVRKEGNKIRKLKLPKYSEWKIKFFDPLKAGEPKYKLGDFVYRKLDAPRNALNNNQNTKQFRTGDFRWDTTARKIKKVLYMPDAPWYRYMLEGIPQASYGEIELMPSNKGKDKAPTYEILKFEGFRTNKKQKQVLIHWRGFPVSENSWENVNEIIKDIGEKSYNLYVKKYNDDYKKTEKKFEDIGKKQEAKLKEQQELEQLEKDFEQPIPRRSARLRK